VKVCELVKTYQRLDDGREERAKPNGRLVLSKWWECWFVDGLLQDKEFDC
jgi:hypothetical protein